jgi:DNA-binding MarR family transcriptional regulator
MHTEAADTEFIILENIYDSSEQDTPLRQRDLAQIAGTSLGMTNSILKRLARKGWISVKKLNSRKIHYAVTLEGINEIIRRSYGYFKRTIRNVVFYKDRIDEAILKAKGHNISTVLLVGMSDLEFILEHVCQRHGLSFFKAVDDGIARHSPRKNTLVVYAETIPVAPAAGKKDILYLSRMVIEKTAGTEKGAQGMGERI